MPLFVPLMCLLGMGLARFWVPAQAVAADPAAHDDAPARLLRWTVGLLPAQRAEWGQAMLGELDHIDGRVRRWHFTVGCAGTVALLPPWGRAAAVVWAMIALAAGSAGLYASVCVRYGLGTGDWVIAAIVLALLAGYVLVAGVQARRPGVTLPGLLVGLLVALAWVGPHGFTFYGFIVAVPPHWVSLLQLIVMPLTGVVGTLWRGSAVAGRRIACLAGLSAGLGLFLYGTLAVAVIGVAGAQIDATWTVSANVSDRLGNNAVFYLWLLPLTTAALGWAGAAATARVRPRLAASVTPVPVAAAGRAGEGSGSAMVPPARTRSRRRLLLAGAVVAAFLMLAVTMLAG